MLPRFNALIAAATLVSVLGPASLGNAQTPPPWVYYGYYITDVGDSVVARYEVQVDQTPWQIALAQFGRKVVPFEDEAVSTDTSRIDFRWPGRAHDRCTLRRQAEALWTGLCRSTTPVSARALSIGVTQAPDFGQDLPPSAADIAILKRAQDLLASEAVWNRADERICEDDAQSGVWSLFCALYQASITESGQYLHRRPVMEVVRQVILDTARDRVTAHALRDYNNDHRTSFAELHQLLARSLGILEGQTGRPR